MQPRRRSSSWLVGIQDISLSHSSLQALSMKEDRERHTIGMHYLYTLTKGVVSEETEQYNRPSECTRSIYSRVPMQVLHHHSPSPHMSGGGLDLEEAIKGQRRQSM